MLQMGARCNLCLVSQRLKITLSVYIFSNQGQIKITKGEDGLCAEDIVSGSLTPTAHTFTRLWETFPTFYYELFAVCV